MDVIIFWRNASWVHNGLHATPPTHLIAPIHQTMQPPQSTDVQQHAKEFLDVVGRCITEYSVYIGGVLFQMLSAFFSKHGVTDSIHLANVCTGCAVDQFINPRPNEAQKSYEKVCNSVSTLIRNEARALISVMADKKTEESTKECVYNTLYRIYAHRMLAAIRAGFVVADQIAREGSENPVVSISGVYHDLEDLRQTAWSMALEVEPSRVHKAAAVFIKQYADAIMLTISVSLNSMHGTLARKRKPAAVDSAPAKLPKLDIETA